MSWQNDGFAWPERMKLFITTGKALYCIPMKVSGQ